MGRACQLELNPSQCEVMHFWRINKDRTYTLSGGALGSITEQWDHAVQVQGFLKVAAQVDKVAKKVYWSSLREVGNIRA